MDDDMNSLFKAIAKLKDVEKAIVTLYLEEKSYKEIGEIVGISEKNVSVKIVRLKDKSKYQEATIASITDSKNFVLESVAGNYLEGTVSILEFPDPIPLIAARMACSYVLDRLFSAEQSPDVSQYGKTQRNLARNAVDDLLHGEILLFGQDHISISKPAWSHVQ